MRKFLAEIKEKMIVKKFPLLDWKKREAYYSGPGKYEYIDKDWVSFKVGDKWSEKEHVTTFFKTNYYIPSDWLGKKVVLHIETGGEACVFIDGEIYHGLDENHYYASFDCEKYVGREIEILVEAALNRINKIYVPDPNYCHRMSVAEFRFIDRDMEEFYYNVLSLIEFYELAQKKGFAEREKIEKLLNKLKEMFYTTDIKEVNQFYRDEVAGFNKKESYKMACFGHAHIDVAWLWQFKETVRKCGRTFSTAIRLMENHPQFKFIQSQPQLYMWVKKYYPDLYKQIKEKVKKGQWQVEGGMWVESDTNLVSGESLVRQFLYGKKFMKEEFGVDSKILWLPDVFGYTGSLPQIMKKAEIDYFMTSKISWNDTNDFPYAIFYWKGIDGSSILTHVPRVILPYTYNGEIYADKVYKVKENYEEQKKENVFEYKFGDSSNYFKKDRVVRDDHLMFIYGYGDGGGGVTEEFIEKIKRFDKFPHLPQMEFAQPLEYFKRVAADIHKYDLKYPVWKGELYLEYHRGTYTSQAKVKSHNRKAETEARYAEILSTLTDKKAGNKIREIWQDIALNQFHDILPGTSIHEVYEDVDKIYDSIHKRTAELIDESLAELEKTVSLSEVKDNVRYYIIWNSLGYKRDGFITLEYLNEWKGKKIIAKNSLTGEELKLFVCHYEDKQYLKIYLKGIPSVGYVILELHVEEEPTKTILSDKIENTESFEIENRFFKITFARGNITSIFDKRRETEIISGGVFANELQFFVDKPPRYQAWEQVAEFEELRINEELILEDCSVFNYEEIKVIELNKRFRNSTFKQQIILYDEIDRIDFFNEVDWREREILVKTAFPVRVNSDMARYEIAYGNLLRPTTKNTDFEKALFEVPGHRWVDLSQPGLGVSLINDSKYGYDVKDNVIRLTLLKAPDYPDPECDYGKHKFIYSLYIHDGVYYQSDLLRYADELTEPLLCKEFSPEQGDSKNISYSFVEVTKGNSRLEVIKEAEDGEAFVVRLYEPYGAREKVELNFSSEIEISKAQVVNLLEYPITGEVKVINNRLCFEMEPFEIKTLKLYLE